MCMHRIRLTGCNCEGDVLVRRSALRGTQSGVEWKLSSLAGLRLRLHRRRWERVLDSFVLVPVVKFVSSGKMVAGSRNEEPLQGVTVDLSYLFYVKNLEIWYHVRFFENDFFHEWVRKSGNVVIPGYFHCVYRYRLLNRRYTDSNYYITCFVATDSINTRVVIPVQNLFSN